MSRKVQIVRSQDSSLPTVEYKLKSVAECKGKRRSDSPKEPVLKVDFFSLPVWDQACQSHLGGEAAAHCTCVSRPGRPVPLRGRGRQVLNTDTCH